VIRVIAILCLAEALTLVGVFAFPALVPQFEADWALSNTAAGWISGIYFLGYALAVPFLSSLTDRVDAKRVFLGGIAICTLATLGFGLFASGFWSAMAFRFLGGVGLAGVYMPGLRALVDRVDTPRAISYYTASFSLGTMASYTVAGAVGDWLGWRAAFLVSAGAAVAAALLTLPLAPVRPARSEERSALLDFRPVLRNRAAMGYILGYACHSWELFAFRGWIVGFLAFAQERQQAVSAWSPTVIATIGTGIGMAASIFGADLAIRFDRRRLCTIAMIGSGGLALFFGATSGLPYWVPAVLTSLYTAFIMLDSAALTTGAMLEADPQRKGATVALHSLLGFGAAFAAPLVQGGVLDLVGGATVGSWTAAFAVIGVVALLGPFALAWSRRSPI
jgi:predicted MFS family arabinose efflux permease